MINNINDLVDYSKKKAEIAPSRRDELEITVPGCNEAHIKRIKKEFPLMPESYLEQIKLITIYEKCVGQFNLSPTGGNDLCDSLQYANSIDNNAFSSLFEEHKLIEVGSVEADIVCIGRSDSPNSGYIYLIDIESSNVPVVEQLAVSFEQFLIAAGNFAEVTFSVNDLDEAEADLINRLKLIGLNEEKYSGWKKLLIQNI